MLSFSSYCKEMILEFAQGQEQRKIKEAGLYTFKQKLPQKEKPAGSLSSSNGEIFMLMTPKQFYQLEKRDKLLKNPPKESLTESYWDDLKAMKYTPERDYKSWMENITLRIRIAKNLKNYSNDAIENKIRQFNRLLKSAFNEYAAGYNSQSEKAFREKNTQAKARDFQKDFIAELEKKGLKEDIGAIYEKGLNKNQIADDLIERLKKGLNLEMRMVKAVYPDPAVNKPLLHSSAMMDGLEVEDDQVLIDYIMGKDVPMDGIVKNIYKKDGSQLTKKEIRELFDEIHADVEEKVKKGMNKEKAIKSVLKGFSKDPDGQSGEFKYFFYDGVTKTNSKFVSMDEKELARRYKSYNKTTASYERLFAKSGGNAYIYEPDKSLSQNQKMMKSMGALGKSKEIYDFTLPAYKGLVYMERNWKDIYGKSHPPGLAILNTCPSAALCKSFCYATKGFYTMYSAPSISAAQVLTFLVNHPEQFAKKTAAYLKTLHSKSNKEVIIRWHDAGDFFSRKYFDLIMNIAKGTPNILHYAYTKRVEMIHEVVTGKDFKGNAAPSMSNIPDNFVFNLSYGGRYDKKISKIPELAKFKFSKVIDLDIPAYEKFTDSEGKKLGERRIFSDSVLAKLESIGEGNFNSINAKTVSSKLASMTINGTPHKNVNVESKVASFNYIPKLAVHGAEDFESFKEKNSEIQKHFPGIEKEHAFEMMFKKTKGKQGRFVFDEKKLDAILSTQQVRDLEKKYPNLYKTYLPEEVLRLYKEALKKYYGFDKEILTYDEMVNTPEDKASRNKYHVLVSTNDGDVSAQRRDVQGTLLVIH